MMDRKIFLKYASSSMVGATGFGFIHEQTNSTQNSISVVNVKDFGAIGDGKTDDRISIQNAIDSIAKKGGIVFIPSGIYRLSLDSNHNSGIRIYNNMQLIGEGIGNTILKWLDSVPDDGPHYLVASNEGYVKKVTIRDFEIDGNRQRTNREFNILGEGIEMDGESITIENMYIHNVLGEGIDVDACDGVFINNVMVENTGGNGIHCSDPNNRNVFICNSTTKNCSHGRKASGNVRYGGLVLRGSGIYVNNHRSINDSQIASIEGQGFEDRNEIHLFRVSGESDKTDSEGFRIGMSGKISLTDCRLNFANSTAEGFYTDKFSGQLTLSNCYSSMGSGLPYSIEMEGNVKVSDCFSEIRSDQSISDGFRFNVNGTVKIDNCEVISRQMSHTAIKVENASQGLSLENCRVVNHENVEGHALHVCKFKSVSNENRLISVHGGEYRKESSGGSAIRIESADRSSIQIRDLSSCYGGRIALEVGHEVDGFDNELFISGNRLDGEQISLKVHKSVSNGFIGNNHCSGKIDLSGNNLVVTGNRAKEINSGGQNNQVNSNYI